MSQETIDSVKRYGYCVTRNYRQCLKVWILCHKKLWMVSQGMDTVSQKTMDGVSQDIDTVLPDTMNTELQDIG